MKIRIESLVAVSLLFVASSSAQAPGWTWRLDGEQVTPTTAGELAPGQWAWQQMPPGWHITTTSQGATLFPVEANPLTGRWAVEMELFLFPDPGSEGAGIVLAQPGAPEIGEMRVLFRRDGQVAMEVHSPGGDRVLAGWTADTAAEAHDGKEIRKYVLRVSLTDGVLGAALNGREMLSLELIPGHAAGAMTAGIRVGSGLNVHVSRFDLVKPLAPAKRET
ncbi:MAG TPA: hypothetical protein PLL69_06025 [Gemmatimonadales bacterium]|nr:hypothetical protein [Gemmatimonadales bacterium]